MSRTTEQQYWDATYEHTRVRDVPGDIRRLGLLYALEPWLYEFELLFERLGDHGHGRVLSIGGGIDGTAVWMAQRGAEVTCLDMAEAALRHTAEVASQCGVADRLRYSLGCCEVMPFRGEFDLVLCRKALHHMDVPAALHAMRLALKPSGRLLAHEPICLSSWLGRLHSRFPFHPDYPVIDGERVLSRDDLALVEAEFPGARLEFFGLSTRPSLAYVANRFGLRRVLRPLGRADHRLLDAFPALRPLSSSVIIEAVRRDA